MNILLQEIRAFSELNLHPKQKKYFTDLLEVAKVVKVVKAGDVFSAMELKMIELFVKPKPKQCYRNAHLLTVLFPNKVKYVEGKVSAIIPIDHAFNKVGDSYVDITFEYGLKDDPNKFEYISYGEYTEDIITNIARSKGTYGDYYRYLYQQKLTNNISKMRYALINIEKIKSTFEPSGDEILIRIKKSLTNYFTADRSEYPEGLREIKDDFNLLPGEPYPTIAINDVGNDNRMIEFYVIGKKCDVYNLEFKGFTKC